MKQKLEMIDIAPMMKPEKSKKERVVRRKKVEVGSETAKAEKKEVTGKPRTRRIKVLTESEPAQIDVDAEIKILSESKGETEPIMPEIADTDDQTEEQGKNIDISFENTTAAVPVYHLEATEPEIEPRNTPKLSEHEEARVRELEEVLYAKPEPIEKPLSFSSNPVVEPVEFAPPVTERLPDTGKSFIENHNQEDGAVVQPKQSKIGKIWQGLVKVARSFAKWKNK